MDQPSELDLPESYWNRLQQPAETVVVAPATGGHTVRRHGLHAGVRDARPGRGPLRPDRAKGDPGTGEEGPGVARRRPIRRQKQAWKAPPGTTWPKAQTVELTATMAGQILEIGPGDLAAPSPGGLLAGERRRGEA